MYSAQAIQDEDEFFFIRIDLDECSTTSLAH